jgi:hypothetical protein
MNDEQHIDSPFPIHGNCVDYVNAASSVHNTRHRHWEISTFLCHPSYELETETSFPGCTTCIGRTHKGKIWLSSRIRHAALWGSPFKKLWVLLEQLWCTVHPPHAVQRLFHGRLAIRYFCQFCLLFTLYFSDLLAQSTSQIITVIESNFAANIW